MGATAGDLMARDVVCRWLEQAAIPYDVANSLAFGGADWETIRPERYSDFIFVCGPLGNGRPVRPLMEAFAHCRKAAINVTMLQPLAEWNPFAGLWERDSDLTARPDLTFLSEAPQVPVIGVILAEAHAEYENARQAEAAEMVQQVLSARNAAVVSIDTCLDPNATGLRSPAEVESLIAHMDVVITTRLHGLVLALKNDVPVVAIDTIAGGAKVTRQAEVLGWPLIYEAGLATTTELDTAIGYCLTSAARTLARECRLRAQRQLAAVPQEFSSYMRNAQPILSNEGVLE
jgi:hypothetical protein